VGLRACLDWSGPERGFARLCRPGSYSGLIFPSYDTEDPVMISQMNDEMQAIECMTVCYHQIR